METSRFRGEDGCVKDQGVEMGRFRVMKMGVCLRIRGVETSRFRGEDGCCLRIRGGDG